MFTVLSENLNIIKQKCKKTRHGGSISLGLSGGHNRTFEDFRLSEFVMNVFHYLLTFYRLNKKLIN